MPSQHPDEATSGRIGPLSASDPQMIGAYRLRGVLGSGGMGRVYLGQSQTGKRVAIKVIRADLAEDEAFRRRFAREVAIASTVSALYTAPVLEADPDADAPWFATTYIDGPSLEALVTERGPLAPQTVFTLAAGLAEALAGLHGAGIAHRDLKPANVLLTDIGPYVIDFGIAAPDDATRVTTGTILGTPGFIAPERIEGANGTPAGDVFSLGATLVFAATGHGVVKGDNLAAQLVQMTRGRYDFTGVPIALRPLITRCLARNPKDRPTAPEIARMLVGAGVVAPGPGWFGAVWPIDTDLSGLSRMRRPVSRRRALAVGGATVGAVAASALVAVTVDWSGSGAATDGATPSPVRGPGRVLWRRKTPLNSLYHTSSQLVVTSSATGTVGTDPRTGATIWTDRSAELTAVRGDELVLLRQAYGDQAVSLADGQAQFLVRLPARPAGSVVLAGRFMVSPLGDRLHGFDRTNSRTWSWLLPAGRMATNLVGNDTTLLFAEVDSANPTDTSVVLLDPAGTTVLRRWSASALAPIRRVRDLWLTDSLVIVAGAAEEGVVALHQVDGGRAWSRAGYTPMPDATVAPCPPVLSRSHLIMWEQGRLWGQPLADGVRPWDRGLEATMVVSALSPDKQTLYVVGARMIQAFNPLDGVRHWSAGVPEPVANSRPVRLWADDAAACVAFGPSGAEVAPMGDNLFAIAVT